ncbi:phosphatase PAP2 family protein [Amycolatopsis decaplanina]|uniref:PAP2 superfamily protein n=1 Tax=Amycolatopsis decaplanina DSM 44594 TaxID=1284240 RepID=M2Z0Y2_9PSEU|nr:phosphatase PAP2 family protein [Amycolatopsis decaplanina]EME60917.1 PAP2 superfamily protein [Amycolatopsis decaplanina DSM 44594]
MSGGDDGLYRAVTGFAASVPWLAGPAVAVTEYGLFLVVPAIVAMLWWARSRGPRALASALWVPCSVALAFGVDSVIKALVAEPRPCWAVTGVRPLLPCDPPADFSFPSNHTAIVAAFAAAVFLVRRRWAIPAGIFALLIGLSRVYVGAHYPHDVLAGLVVGAGVGMSGVLARSSTTRFISRHVPRSGRQHADKVRPSEFKESRMTLGRQMRRGRRLHGSGWSRTDHGSPTTSSH